MKLIKKFKSFTRKIQYSFKDKYSFKNNKRIIVPSLLLMFVLLLSIAYSAFGTKLNIGTFVADVRLKKDVRITGVSVVPESEGVVSELVCELASDSEVTGYNHGAKYNCDPGDGVTRTFYVLEDGDTSGLIKGDTGTAGAGEVSLIMDSNIGDTTVWGDIGDTTPTIALSYLYSQTTQKGWTVEVNLPTYNQINSVNNKTNLTATPWLYSDGGDYWTSSGKMLEIYYVTSTGYLTTKTINSPSGVRPVITISKTQIGSSNDEGIQNNGGTSTYQDYNVSNISAGVNLPNEDSSVTLNIEITNLESAEAGILNITGLPDNLDYKLIDYDLGEKLCDDTGKCNLGITKNIGLTIRYKDGGYDSTKTLYDVVANFDFQQFYSVKYTDIKTSTCSIERQVDGKYSVGDVVTCGEEQFYVIENQDTDTTEGIDMLAAYNLTLTENPIQDTSGALNGITFAKSMYWYDSTNNVYTVDANYANEGREPYVYASYIIDGVEQNNIYPYVDKYREGLEGIGVNVIDAKLLSYEQSLQLGCTDDWYCESAPEWLGSTQYWLGTGGGDFIYLNEGGYLIMYNFEEYELGIRPVITISTSEIEELTLPTEILGGSTLTIDFGGSALEYLTIKVDGVEIRNYNYSDGVLTLANVSGDIEITNGIEEYNGTYIALNDRDVLNYTIYGNSTQNGTPTPTSPVDVVSIGERTSNLFDLEGMEFNSSSLTKTGNSITIDNSGSNYANYYYTTNVEALNLKPNTTYTSRAKVNLTLNQTDGSTAGSMSGVLYLQDNTTFSQNAKVQIVGKTYAVEKTPNQELTVYSTFTTPEDLTSLKYLVTRVMGYGIMTFEDIMVVEGEYTESTFPTDYEPYGYKIPIVVSNGTQEVTHNIFIDEPLKKVGEYADYIDFETGTIVRKIGKMVYDGTDEAWGAYTTGKGYLTSNATFIDGQPVLSNRFVNSQSLITSLGIRKNFAHIYCYGLSDTYTTVYEWKDFLTTNPLIVYGPLNTPIEETIELPVITTFDGVTNISAAGAVIDLKVKSKSN